MNQMSRQDKTNPFAPFSINVSQAIVESQRCLGCFDAPCTHACPVHIDVPGFIRRIAHGNLEGSNQLLRERNPMAAVCGLICPTADLCEGACVLPQLGQRAVRIGALQYFVSSQFPFNEILPHHQRAKRIAVIGGGPSSIGCAVVLRRLGHHVHLFDRHTKLGGLVSQVIPSYRLLSDALAKELSRLEQYGIAFHFGVDVTSEMLKDLEREYDAVYLGIGLSQFNPGTFPGSDLAGVHSAMAFLAEARLHAQEESYKPEVANTVVIIGGGNVAIDAAVVARKTGSDRVIVLYRRSLEEMPAWRSEYLDAVEQGIEFRWLSSIKRILGEGNRVKAVEVQPMRWKETQSDGRRGVEPDPFALTYHLLCDKVLLALGQRLDNTWAEEAGIAMTDTGGLTIDRLNHQTNQPGLFAGGEAVIGGSTVVACLADGMTAGYSIHDWFIRQESD